MSQLATVTARPKTPATSLASGVLQRKCACGQHTTDQHGQCTECGKNRLGLQRRAVNAGGPEIAPPIVHEVLRSPGRPLDSATRAFMEPRFGHGFSNVPTYSAALSSVPARLAIGASHDPFEQEADIVADQIASMPVPPNKGRYDFSGVRIHTDARAAEAARLLNAHAFTVGQHLVFDAGGYAPHTVSGQRLLAHELAHVIQQTGQMAGNDRTQRTLVEHRLTIPRIQGRWRLDRVRPDEDLEIEYIRENGTVQSSSFGNNDPMVGGVLGHARTWQETGFVRQKVGGEAQVAHWLTKHFIFKKYGDDNHFLQLRINAQLAGNAKAEDLRYARAGAIVWGRITERTAVNPTPPDRALFQPIKDGGISAATVGDLGVIEGNIPIGEHGSVRITIPLKKVDEGAFAPFSESTNQLHDVSSTVDEVDVLLGARIEADADIQSAFFGIAPWLSRNRNNSNADARFLLNWESRPAPTSAAPSPIPGRGGDPGALARKWGCTNVQCNVQQIDQDANCPERVRGDSDYIYSSLREACDAAKRDANRMVPRGCYKRHCDCNTKCSQR